MPFEVASFEHFGLERPFNMAAMIVFTPKYPSEGDIYRLERTDRLSNIHKPIIAVNVYLQVYNAPPQFKLSVQMRGGGVFRLTFLSILIAVTKFEDRLSKRFK